MKTWFIPPTVIPALIVVSLLAYVAVMAIS